MSHTTDESEDSMLLKDKTDSPLIEEGSSGGGVVLKKGPWTSTEDTILVDYVKKHGEGNWNAVQKHSGLFRCGKSCRLRWANHLRPNLKKGSFTMEEEKLIIELHAKMGNKWAQMATHLPGRTDNEIKNYWNTRIKRQQRAGLPLYPPDVCLQALNENQQSTGEFNSGDAHHHDLLQANSYDIPDVIFNDLKANPGVLMYGPPLPNISVSNMLTQGLGCTHNYSLMPPTVHCRKRHRQLETVFGCNGSVINELPPFDQFQNDSCEKIHRPFGLSFPYDPDPNSKTPPLFGVMPGSHTLLNGNFSASKPIYEAVKLELPSLQYSESDLGSWGTFPPLPPSLDSLDTLRQSLLPIESVQSDCLSPRKSGLLEALLHEAQTLSSAKNLLAEKSSSSSVVMPSDMVDSSTLNPFETEWNEYSDPISPLGRSAASSIFSECTPISGSSLDEPPPAETLPGFDVKTEPIEHLSTPDRGEKEISSQLEFFRPDALLGSDWFEQTSDCGKDQSIVTDTIATLLGDDICSNYKHISASSLSQGFGLGSCAWSNLPTVCQMYELP